ncbi:MAG: adenosine deaminase [Gammaproteobacteria bacterium]|nr:adenosine deaminase [Gammaproteobacteria bacterium]
MKEFIQNMPKAELQVHIEGTLEPELLFELAKRNKVELPYATLEDAKKAMPYQNLPSFLVSYYANLKVLLTEQDFYDLTLAYLEKAASQNIRHTEISFDAQAHLNRGISLSTVMVGMHRAMQDAEQKCKISSGLILCFMRDLSEDDAQKVLLEALEFKDWIMAIGLDSSEMNNPPEKFKNVFDRAREYGFLTVAAAGEVGPAEYIWQAIDVLHVSRIDYGIHCVEDPDLMSRLVMKKIPISVCPVSNVKLGIIKSMQKHPLKKMLEEGLCVTINSDDPAYFHAYLNENFLAAQAGLSFHKDEIYEMARNAFLSSFLDNDKKEKYLLELDHYYNQ